MSSRYLELAPTNKTTDDKYAFKKGVAQVNFDIPEGNFVLDPSSVRIVGDIRFYKNDADATPVDTEALAISSRLGVWSCFQQLIWRSSKFQTTISHEKNWNRWLASYLALSSGFEDSVGHFSESALTFPNFETSKRSIVAKDTRQSFCVHLPCGLLQSGQSIPLTSNTLGGLSLSIMLESDAQVLQVLPTDFATSPATAGFTSAYYELSNLKLVCSVITPPPDELSRLMSQKEGQMTFQSVHSFYDTSTSSQLQVAMNFGLQRVKSLYISMIPSDKLNNLAADSFGTLGAINTDGTLADITKVSILRGGTLFPKLYPRDTNVKEITDTMSADPVVTRDYVNSVVAFDKIKHCLASTSTSNRNYVGSIVGGNNTGIPYQLVNDGGVVQGIGVNFDNYLNGVGVELAKQPFSVALECNLTSNNSQSLFLFVNAETTLLFDQSGVQVRQ
jgi:hypothetical protein